MFLLLIVSSLFCNFNRLSVPFVFILHEHRLQEYSKMSRVQNVVLGPRKSAMLLVRDFSENDKIFRQEKK